MSTKAWLAQVLLLGLIASGGCGPSSVPRGEPPSVTSRGEFGSHISVEARLSQPPRVGSALVLEVDLMSDRPYRRASLLVELPRGLVFDHPPPGLEVLGEPSKNPARGGPRARKAVHLDGMASRVIRIPLTVRSRPTGELAVFVHAPVPGGTDGGSDYLFLGSG